MAQQVQWRRGTTAENDAFTGAVGEITVDTSRDELRIHDGTTAGGHRVPTDAFTSALAGLVPASGGGTTNFLRADGSWAAPPTGTIADGDYGDVTVSGSGTVMTVDNDAITYAKMQDVSATDKVLGRSTAGAGDVEEIACTSAGRALLDDADASAQRTTLGLAIGTNVQAYDAELAAIAGLTSAADRVPYFTGSGTADVATFTSAGRALVDDANAAAQRTTLELSAGSIQVVIGDGTNVITTGVKGYMTIPFACTITGWDLVADASGSIVIDVWKDTYENFPPVDADSIAGTELPTLSSVQKNQDTSLTTWTDTTVDANDWLGFNVDSAATVKQVTLSIRYTR